MNAIMIVEWHSEVVPIIIGSQFVVVIFCELRALWNLKEATKQRHPKHNPDSYFGCPPPFPRPRTDFITLCVTLLETRAFKVGQSSNNQMLPPSALSLASPLTSPDPSWPLPPATPFLSSSFPRSSNHVAATGVPMM